MSFTHTKPSKAVSAKRDAARKAVRTGFPREAIIFRRKPIQYNHQMGVIAASNAPVELTLQAERNVLRYASVGYTDISKAKRIIGAMIDLGRSQQCPRTADQPSVTRLDASLQQDRDKNLCAHSGHIRQAKFEVEGRDETTQPSLPTESGQGITPAGAHNGGAPNMRLTHGELGDTPLWRHGLWILRAA